MISQFTKMNSNSQDCSFEYKNCYSILCIFGVIGLGLATVKIVQIIYDKYQNSNKNPNMNSFVDAHNVYKTQNVNNREACFSFRLSNVISQVKDAFSRFYASLPRPPKKHDIRRDLTEQIPFLRREIRDRNDKISQILKFVKSHPDLLAMSVKAWVEFAPKAITLIKLEEYEPLDILEKTSYLEGRILNCDIVLENYKSILLYNPEIKELFKRYLLPQTPQITGSEKI